MDFNIDSWLNLAIRWFHVMAGIMWIGTSFFFIWLDNVLQPLPEGGKGHVGKAWLFHGGGFYQVEKALVAQTTDALKLAEARFKAGVDDRLATLDAQRSLYAAQQALVQVQLSQQLNRVTLYKALGGGTLTETQAAAATPRQSGG